jgi:hypothetical protein
VGEPRAAVFLDPRECQIDARGDAGRRVDVPVLDPERVVLDAYAGISLLELAAELPVRGRSAPVQQPRLREKKGADAHGAEPPHLGRPLLQPGRQRRVTHRSSAQSADQEHGVALAFDPVDAMPGDEGQHTALALDRQTVAARDDLDRIDGPARKPIHRVEHLERSHQIELVDRRHDEDEDPAARRGPARTGSPGRGGHASSHYAEAPSRFASGTSAMADFDGSVSEIDVPSSDTMPARSQEER